MGFAFVFVFYVAAVGVLACIGAAAGSILGRYITRRTPALQQRFSLAGALIPVGAGSYFLFCIIAMAIFGSSTGRDFGFGDGFHVPLQNSYHWSAIDQTTSACIYPGDSENLSFFCSLPNHNPNVFIDVLALQEYGDWIAGSFDSRENDFMNREQQRSDRWFLFNTKTHERYDAPNEQSLAKLSMQHGFTLKLESSSDFYNDHRYRWFDGAMVIALLLPGVASIVWLYTKARRMLRQAPSAGPGAVQST